MVEGDSGSGTGWGGRETRAPGALKAVVRLYLGALGHYRRDLSRGSLQWKAGPAAAWNTDWRGRDRSQDRGED